jgi:hypothetical protein
MAPKWGPLSNLEQDQYPNPLIGKGRPRKISIVVDKDFSTCFLYTSMILEMNAFAASPR